MVVPSSISWLSSSSSASSLSSPTSSEGIRPVNPSGSGSTSLKLLCSYGGKILPRHSDGKLRYAGGITRLLAVDRSVSFSELLERMEVMCGCRGGVSLKCKLPTEDLDALVSVTSDEDLANLVEEYDLASQCKGTASSPTLKIRAFLYTAPPQPSTSPSTSPSSTTAVRTQQMGPCRASTAAAPQQTPVPLGFPSSHRQIQHSQQHRHHHQHLLLGAVRGIQYCAPSHGHVQHTYLVHQGRD